MPGVTHQFPVPKTVFQEGVSDRPRPEKDNRAREPNFETGDVEPVDGELESKQNVVEHADGD